jgi:anaerobic selenocysteine-containing dehydrogenase
MFRHLDLSGLERPDLLAGRSPRTINMNRLGDALSLDPARLAAAHYHPRPVDPVVTAEHAGPPVKALIVYNSNPAAVAPDQAAATAGLRREDLFTVVLEQFPTDTADYADYVLPATTQLEHWDILKPYGHLHLALNRPAIAPLGESLPNSEIFRRLAGAMGYTEGCFGEQDEEILRALVAAQAHPRFATVTWQRLLDEGFVRLNVPEPFMPFAEGGFPTPSGKCEFYSARMAADGYDPLPAYTPPQSLQERAAPDAGDDTLACISPPAHSFLNSTFVNVPRFRTREEEPVVQIHPDDARARGIADGDTVRVENERGSVVLAARLTPGLMPGVVLAPGVWWAKFSPDGRNINQVTPPDEADMGAGALFYDVRVRVARVGEAAGAEHLAVAAQPGA